jgi:hypothetical protein
MQRSLTPLNSLTALIISPHEGRPSKMLRIEKVLTPLRQNLTFSLSSARVSTAQVINLNSTKYSPSQSYLQALTKAPLKSPTLPLIPAPHRSTSKTLRVAASVVLVHPIEGRTAENLFGAKRAIGMDICLKRADLLLFYLARRSTTNFLTRLYVLSRSWGSMLIYSTT